MIKKENVIYNWQKYYFILFQTAYFAITVHDFKWILNKNKEQADYSII